MRMWEIRENSEYPEKKNSYDKSEKYDEAYQMGYEDGYTKAMKEVYFHDRKAR